MIKTQIISIANEDYMVGSISAATQLATLLAKLVPVKRDTSSDHYKEWHYKHDDRNRYPDLTDVSIKLNEKFKPSPKPKAEPKSKTLSLPAPKRGTILCICEKSHVAPRQSCPHCGRAFSESHNRTHSNNSGPNLRLL